MAIHNARTEDYGHTDGKQASKKSSIEKAEKFVEKIKNLISPHLKVCETYKPGKELRINGAPAVRLPDGKLVIAPDLRCTTHSGKVFWVEAKDKCQRGAFPDTGGDLHQVLGWYQISSKLREPVLLVFQDPPLEQGILRITSSEDLVDYKERWARFKGEPYGNWLSICLEPKDCYPQIFWNSSREVPLFILYFHVNTMKTLGSFAEVVKESEYQKRPKNLAAFHSLGLEQLLPLSIGGPGDKEETQKYVDLARDIISLVDSRRDSHAPEDRRRAIIDNPTAVTQPPSLIEDQVRAAAGNLTIPRGDFKDIPISKLNPGYLKELYENDKFKKIYPELYLAIGTLLGL